MGEKILTVYPHLFFFLISALNFYDGVLFQSVGVP